ncbi:MAG: DUF3798 domain-containing protein [Eubacteriales bacterium]|nr:DUF3798 domain-containing protein [Eubacteriales bacterium]
MKKFLSLLVAVAMLCTLATFAVAEEGNWKVAVLTATTTQGEEEYRAAEKLKELYPDHVVTDTYPDNFSSETETTIGKLIEFASDPDVKAIIFVQGVQGATAAFTQIKQDLGRDDILLMTGVPAEDPSAISPAADVILSVDEPGCGYQVADICSNWGVDVLVHLSFARHMSYETIVAKYNNMKEECDDKGIEFLTLDVSDPTGDAGMTGAQNSVIDVVASVMEEHPDQKVGFYTTNCGLQETLQAQVLQYPNAYYALPCCPSPFHGFPASLGIEVTADQYGDVPSYLHTMASILAEHDALSRFSTWGVPVNMSMIYGCYDYAVKWINGEFTEKLNEEELIKCVSAAAGGDCQFTKYESGDGTVFDNYYMVLGQPVDFNDYAK